MISSVRGSVLALVAVGFSWALGAPAQAGCVGLSGTADGFDKETAVSRAQLALADYVKQYKTVFMRPLALALKPECPLRGLRMN